ALDAGDGLRSSVTGRDLARERAPAIDAELVAEAPHRVVQVVNGDPDVVRIAEAQRRGRAGHGGDSMRYDSKSDGSSDFWGGRLSSAPRDVTGRALALRDVDLSRLLDPKVIAVVGASDSPGSQ